MTQQIYQKIQLENDSKKVYSQLIKKYGEMTVIAYIIGGATGLAMGFAAGLLKYRFLWKSIIKSDREITMKSLYARMGISYGINIAVLAAVFFLRGIIPTEFVSTLLGTAVGLSLAGKLAPPTKIAGHVKSDQVKENAS